MNFVRKLFYLVIFLLCTQQGRSQNSFILNSDRPAKIRFSLINNLIVIPVEVNNVSLSFILDTGVSRPILFNVLNFKSKLEVNNKELIYLRGLGDGETVEAIKSTNNVFKIGKIISANQDLYAINDPDINFLARLGVPIHGIIGYDFFKDFIVEINYSKEYLKVHNPEYYSKKMCKKCTDLDMVFHNKKPFINIKAGIDNDSLIDVQLLLDSGGSDALWLFENSKPQIKVPEKHFHDYLGRGLSGNVFGKRTKINQIKIGDFLLKEVNAAFPDSTAIGQAKQNVSRNGSLAGNILKRFNIIFNYQNKKIRFKKNRYFNTPFRYNKSGISLEYQGVRLIKKLTNKFNNIKIENNNESQYYFATETYEYVFVPAYKIVQIRKDSPADKAGLLVNDVIISINKKPAHTYDLHDIISIFYGDEGRVVKMVVERNSVHLKYQFTLKSML